MDRRSKLIGLCILLVPGAGVLQAEAPGYGLIALLVLIVVISWLVGDRQRSDARK